MVAPIIAAGSRIALGARSRAAAARGVAATEERSVVTERARPSWREDSPQTATRTRASNPPRERRISIPIAGFMVTVALTIDGAQGLISFIPVIGSIIAWFLGIFAIMAFGVWFLLMGISYFDGKKALLKMAAVFGGSIAELMPILDVLPAITFSVIVIIIASWAEDRGSGALRQSKVLARFARKKYSRAGTG